MAATLSRRDALAKAIWGTATVGAAGAVGALALPVFPADQLSSSGLEGTLTAEPAPRSVTGGTGTYRGATGEVLQHTIGANITGGPNFRFAFTVRRGGR